ncbi:hypothetical protein N7505_008556 [Penicillium chrysogenum]|jgi:hypothetical protein|uniref:Uncharacterized protein n=2 Tax=Penicillium chrysogenum TaxID=5076 RepID=A0ABQ8WAW1_PENCH|nr:hypothetical protein N7505_008556 [Penicillium chrysogenum]
MPRPPPSFDNQQLPGHNARVCNNLRSSMDGSALRSMRIPILLSVFVGQCMASSSTPLLSWQLDANSRSAWDILWTCLSTIFACTWTLLHMDVPPRNMSIARCTLSKMREWILAILAPEVIFLRAIGQLADARNLQKVCNKAQKTRDVESSEPKLWLSQRTRPLEQVQNLDHVDLHPVHTEWTLRQCFCIIAGGLVLQTQDQWIYKIQPRDMKPLIQAGMVHCSDFRDQDIEDRAKADSFAKFFTVLQSTWFICNVITRWAYDLPISPIELSTLAYVGCAILIYGVWWYKPKDMGTSIAVHLRCNRDDMPIEVRNMIDGNPTGWVHVRALVNEDNWVHVLWKTVRTPFLRRDIQHLETINEADLMKTPFQIIVFDLICSLTALLYCGIHVAA